MKRIIHITSKPPFPIVDGGCFASAALLNDLYEISNELIHISLTTQKHPGNKESYPDKFKNIKFFHCNTEIHFYQAMKSSIKGTSYNIDRFKNVELNNFLSGLLEDEDIIIIDGLYASGFIDQVVCKNATMILREHNVEYKIWEELSDRSSYSALRNRLKRLKVLNPFKRMYVKHLSKRLKKYELKVLSKVDQVWTISDEDKKTLEGHGIHHTRTLPVSISTSFAEHDYSNNSVFHLGSAEWLPNAESIELLRQLHNVLLGDGLGVELHLFGSKIENSNQQSETIHGFVKDLNPYLEKMGFLCAPVVSGSGIRIKILETMSRGIPVLTTSKGAQGINDRSALLIADTFEELLKVMKTLILSEDLRQKMGQKAQKYICENHSFESVRSLLNSSIHEEA